MEESATPRKKHFYRAGPIRILRIQSGLTLREVAERAELSIRRLSVVETGLCNWRQEELQRIVTTIEALAAERRSGGGQ